MKKRTAPEEVKNFEMYWKRKNELKNREAMLLAAKPTTAQIRSRPLSKPTKAAAEHLFLASDAQGLSLPQVGSPYFTKSRAGQSQASFSSKFRQRFSARNSVEIQVKVQSAVSVTPDDLVSVLLPYIRDNPSQEVRLYYKNCPINPDLTFAYQGVVDSSEIRAEPVFALHCQTPNITVTLKVTGVDSIEKVKMDAAVAARLDLTQHYILLLNGIALSDDLTVASAKLNSTSSLFLRQNVVTKSPTRISKALVQSAF